MRKTNTQREKPSCSVLVFPHIFGGVGGWGDSIYRARKKHLSLSLGIQHQGFLLLYSIPSISYLIFFFFWYMGEEGKERKHWQCWILKGSALQEADANKALLGCIGPDNQQVLGCRVESTNRHLSHELCWSILKIITGNTTGECLVIIPGCENQIGRYFWTQKCWNTRNIFVVDGKNWKHIWH